jgi:solute carrier family 45 protein 1/2/4
MIVLTLVQAGAQVAWCLEFGYGTPYLLSIGLSKSATSLVWLAAPISGLVVQPAIGVMSDLSTSNWRRRQFIIASSALLAWATLVLAYSMPLSSAIVDVLHVGVADWDPIRVHARDDIKRLLAIIAFVSLDVSINGLQVSARALVLDVTPSSMHSRANAWSSRMMHAGNVFGYAAGWLDLGSASWLAWLGDGQLRKYAMVSLVAILLGSTVTCLGIEEAGVNDAGADDATIGGAADNEGEIDPTFSAAASVRPDLDAPLTFSQHCYGALMHIWQTLRRLPRSVRRICLVQLFANMAWFPFLFYATQWVIEVWQAEHRDAPPPADHANDDDERERLGSYALLLFALVSLAAATVLPYLALANWTSSCARSHNPETETLLPSSRNGSVSSTKSEQPARWRLSLRTIWTCAMTLLCLQMGLLTFFVDTYDHAVALVASIGVPFAVALWVPYALVMESVREAQDGMSPFEFEGDWFSPERVRGRRQRQRDTHGFQRSAAPSPMSIGRGNAARAVQDCGPLRGPAGPDQTAYQHSIVSRGCRVVSSNVRAVSPSPSRHGGQTGIRHGNDKDDVGATILGIHNMAIVLPMIVVAIVSSLILRTPRSTSTIANGSTEQDGVGVVWILRLGGLAALCAAFLTRLVPLSRSERLLLGDPATLRQLRSVDDEDDEEDDED